MVCTHSHKKYSIAVSMNNIMYWVSQNNGERLCGYCGAAIDSIISVFTQLHRSGFNLEFETLPESM